MNANIDFMPFKGSLYQYILFAVKWHKPDARVSTATLFIANLDTGDATRSGFIKGNLGEAGVIFAGLHWGLCILYVGNQCFGAS